MAAEDPITPDGRPEAPFGIAVEDDMRLTPVLHRPDLLAHQPVKAPIGIGERCLRFGLGAGIPGPCGNEPIDDQAGSERALWCRTRGKTAFYMHDDRRAGCRCRLEICAFKRVVVTALRDGIADARKTFLETCGIVPLGHPTQQEEPGKLG